jgi:two-component system sensor histidine kinase YesM
MLKAGVFVVLKLLSRFNTIKNKILFSYVLLLIIPLSLVAMVNYIKSANILEEKAVEQFDTVSQLANQQFDQFFIDIESF